MSVRVEALGTANTIIRSWQVAVEGARGGLMGERLPIPRTTLAIATAIYTVFPEEVNEIGVAEAVWRIGTLSPVLIALNEAADIGVSARLKRVSDCGQEQFLPLFSLENGLMRDLQRRKRELLAKHTDNKDVVRIVDVFINDFMLLSEKRREFPQSEHKKWVELDSALFETASIALVSPQILEDAGVDFLGKPCMGKSDLEDKYGLFLTDKFNEPDNLMSLNDSQRGLLGLHCAEMILKLRDDQEGEGVDRLLGLPSFLSYAESLDSELPREVFHQLKQHYALIAKTVGFPVTVLKVSEWLFYFTSVLKSAKAIDGAEVTGDLYQVSRFYDKDRLTTTLRHEIDGSGLLTELYRH